MSGSRQVTRVALAGAFACASLALVACGGDDDPSPAATTPTGATDLDDVASEAGCELRLDLPDEGNQHLAPGEPAPEYGTNPPTSGPHHPVPAEDGAYPGAPPTPKVVHSLEHGRIAIQYSTDLPQKDQQLLEGVFDEDAAGVLLFSNPDMPYEVAATAWTNLVGCDSFSEKVLDVVRDFRDEFRGKGPERIPIGGV
jgi:hypothetical protein